MKNNNTISVIIPIFNVEKYLGECLDSVINQTYKNLQIILVDDGSTDNSGKICDEYAAKDSRIVVIHQKNAGAGAAKNAGLEKATGEYLAFVDSDDYLELEAYEKMLEILVVNEADIVQCNHRDIYQNKVSDRIFIKEEQMLNAQQCLCDFTKKWVCSLFCNKLFKASLFKDIRFEEGHRIDDEYFTYRGVMNADKIIYSPLIFYNYRQRASSVMNDSAAERILLDRLDYTQKRRNNIIKKFPQLKKTFDYNLVDSLLLWSKDENLTDAVILKIKETLEEYLKKEGYFEFGFGLGLQLRKLKKASSEKLLENRQHKKTEESNYVYFE